jgi:hypothetical protein
MTEQEGVAGDGEQVTDAPAPRWSVVANVVTERLHGTEATMRRGTKHFRAGTKVHLVSAYWGMGAERVTALGLARRPKRWITVDLDSRALENWRARMVYKPAVLRHLADVKPLWRDNDHGPVRDLGGHRRPLRHHCAGVDDDDVETQAYPREDPPRRLTRHVLGELAVRRWQQHPQPRGVPVQAVVDLASSEIICDVDQVDHAAVVGQVEVATDVTRLQIEVDQAYRALRAGACRLQRQTERDRRGADPTLAPATTSMVPPAPA